MKTDDLVSMLASGAGAVDPKALRRRAFVVIGGAILISTLLMIAWLGPNPALRRDSLAPMFWVREAFCTVLAVGALFAVARLGRPGAVLTGLRPLLVAPIGALWLLAAVVLLAADADERAGLVQGVSWTECSYNIALLSLPVFAAIIGLMRSLAPTRLRQAGAAAGFAAGAMGALVYTLHCPELEAPFLAIWYVVGMLIPTAVGALAGPHLLRW